VSPDAVTATVVDALDALVGLPYDGEPVDQLQHALQCADHARRSGAGRELVLAALLHDVARSPHVAGEADDAGPLDHGQQGARWLAPLLGAQVAWLAGAHVAAKRYLVATESAYAAGLSAVSARTLRAQGGAMSPEEVATFEAHDGWRDAVALRRWDDLGKDPDARVPGVAAYVDDLREQARCAAGC
jgi:predicted HD phosphohydrolase